MRSETYETISLSYSIAHDETRPSVISCGEATINLRKWTFINDQLYPFEHFSRSGRRDIILPILGLVLV